ncbi:MAG: Mss4p nuclear export [Sarea resinae]|nr:MAG: Mss4p nuclear export [Sarea resinae]
MAKRKQSGNDADGKGAHKDDRMRDGSDDSSSDEDTDMLNVDFEWFDPQPDHDFHGLKTLLRQLLDVDAQLFDLSALSDLILSQPLLGSTVKVDGNESDPYAFLTVLNLHEHQEQQVIKDLTSYLRQKAASNPTLSQLSNLLSSTPIPPIGLILTERLINVPSEVVPPMYKMLLEEISWAVEEKEPYTFSHYLILSKAYTEVASKLDEQEDRPQKKKRKDGSSRDDELFYFHPEDEALHSQCLAYGSFDYSKQGGEGSSDSKRAFQELGIRPQGHVMLIEGSKIDEAVQTVDRFLNGS